MSTRPSYGKVFGSPTSPGSRDTPGPGQRMRRPPGRRGSGAPCMVPPTSLPFPKLRVSETYNAAKAAWTAAPENWGTEEIPSPPPKKSCAGRARNSVARAAVQIRTGHWRLAVFLCRIRDGMTGAGSATLTHYRIPRSPPLQWRPHRFCTATSLGRRRPPSI